MLCFFSQEIGPLEKVGLLYYLGGSSLLFEGGLHYYLGEVPLPPNNREEFR